MDSKPEMVEISREELERLIEEAKVGHRYRENSRKRVAATRARRKAQAALNAQAQGAEQ